MNFALTKISILVSTLFYSWTYETKPEYKLNIINQMFINARQVKTASYTLRKIERIKGEHVEEVNDVRLNIEPFQLYFKQIKPVKGLEILYPNQQQGKKALINPNSFPMINLNLDPKGYLMRRNQHHTLHKSGFAYLVSISEHLINKYPDQIEHMINLKEAYEWNGKKCWKIELLNPHFKFIQYTVHDNEGLSDIANKFRISEYMIIERNPGLSLYDKLNAGSVIKIPNDYAARIELLIDQIEHLPVVIKIYDDHGLFEQYEYKNLITNLQWDKDEFKQSCKRYNF